jgi:tetratricopeptide (TPR) repeat protein
VRAPAPEPLTDLLARVAFHPLSIAMIVRELKQRPLAELGARLEALLKTETDPLLASLALSLDRLDPASRAWLPRLALFQAGAWEPMIKGICEPEDWPTLRRGLEQTGLVHPEPLPGTDAPYLRFHPTLAPALSRRLSAEDKARLSERYRQGYYELSTFLYELDSGNVTLARVLASRELPNLLAAVDDSFAAGEERAVEFANTIGRFLTMFGRRRDHEALTRRAQAAAGAVGSEAWVLARSGEGERLATAGRHAEAEALFREVLDRLGPDPSFDRCATLAWLGRCCQQQGRLGDAEALTRRGLDENERLETTPEVRRQRSVLQADLGDILRDRGDYPGALSAHEAALAIAREIGDQRGVAVGQFQLGTLAYLQGDLAGAERAYHEALATFRALGEPAAEATAWHQLGSVYQRARAWPAAEQALRESARLKESRGDTLAAAASWDQLAQVIAAAGRPGDAEGWSLKALAAFQVGGDLVGASRTLHNLADLLSTQPDRLADARHYAEQALALKQTIDPAAAELWKTYSLLATLAGQSGEPGVASDYRRQAREAFAAAPVAAETRRRFAPLIAAMLAATADPARRPELEADLAKRAERGWGALVAALHALLDGARDEATLCDPLDWEASAIVAAVLRGLAG